MAQPPAEPARAVPPIHPWIPSEPILLASASVTRRVLLEGAGLPVETIAAEIDERAIEADSAGLAPSALACRLAEAKAAAVAALHPGRFVIGADQVLELDGTVFHKPTNLESARTQIGRLAGRRHALHAAVALAENGRVGETLLESAHLTMRVLDEAAIAAYLSAAGPARVTASVGGYQLEGLGIHLFTAVDGEQSTILGLPLLPLLARLRARGFLRI